MERALQNIALPVDIDQCVDDNAASSLIDILDKMGNYAAAQGLTEEMLSELLEESK